MHAEDGQRPCRCCCHGTLPPYTRDEILLKPSISCKLQPPLKFSRDYIETVVSLLFVGVSITGIVLIVVPLELIKGVFAVNDMIQWGNAVRRVVFPFHSVFLTV
jgi:hypothetical protein